MPPNLYRCFKSACTEALSRTGMDKAFVSSARARPWSVKRIQFLSYVIHPCLFFMTLSKTGKVLLLQPDIVAMTLREMSGDPSCISKYKQRSKIRWAELFVFEQDDGMVCEEMCETRQPFGCGSLDTRSGCCSSCK